MSVDFETLRHRAKTLNVIANDAESWLIDCAPEGMAMSKRQAIKGIGRQARLLERVASVRPSVFLFGLSQVGKSYLIHNMAVEDDGRMYVDAGQDLRFDFLRDMNPVGGKESTGFASRFFVRNDEPNWSPAFPFRAELLSMSDLVCIILDSFCNDIQQHQIKLDRYSVQKDISLLNGIVTSSSTINGFDEDEVHWMMDHINQHFNENVIIRDLIDFGYVDALVKNLPLLPIADVGRFVAVLWGGNAFWSNFFNRMYEQMANLNFARTVWLTVDALSPNDQPQARTILDVKRVKDWYEGLNLDVLQILDDQTHVQFEVDRCTLSTLIKEVALPMNRTVASGTRQFLREVDLVDFPGARSRKKAPLAVFESNPDKDNSELIVRGKVSYLFHLYRREMGISTMVYCLDDRQSEVQDVPQLVYSWIRAAIGKNPQERANRQKELGQILHQGSEEVAPFLVAFTKFNVEIEGKNEKLGDISRHDEKWYARFEANFKEWFELPVNDPWVSNWTGTDEAFHWVFPIRDPQYSKGIFVSDNSGETELRPDMQIRLTEAGQSFVSHPAVNRHIIDAKSTWNHLLSPNQSGAEPLQECLAKSAHPIIKIKQIESFLEALEVSLKGILQPLLVDGDPEQQMLAAQSKGGKAKLVFSAMLMRTPRKFTNFLRALEFSRKKSWSLFYQAHETIAMSQEGDGNLATEKKEGTSLQDVFEYLGLECEITDDSDSMIERLSLHLNLNRQEIESTLNEMFPDFVGLNAPAIMATGTPNKARIYAKMVIESWKAQTESFLNSEELIAWGISDIEKEQIASIVYALHERADLMNIEMKLASEINDDFKTKPTSEIANMVAAVSESMVNQFVQSGSSEPRTTEDDNSHLNEILPNLLHDNPQNKTPFAQKWLSEMTSLFMKNAQLRGVNVDEQFLKCNQRLRDIIQSIG